MSRSHIFEGIIDNKYDDTRDISVRDKKRELVKQKIENMT